MVKVKFNGKEWITLPKYSKEGLYLDHRLKVKLDNIKKLQKNDWDFVGLIVGDEGSGKSTLSFVIGQYLTNMNLQLHQICSGAEDAMEKLKTLPDKSLIIIDEAELLFSSRETMKREQKKLTQILMVIRQKGMILILVSPVFHDLAKYIAIHRSRFLLKTYCDSKMHRGRFAYWGEKKKKLLYELGKKNFGSYLKPAPAFRGMFTNYKLPYDDEYQKTKLKSLTEAFEGNKNEMIKESSRGFIQRDYLMLELNEKYGLTHKQIADIFKKYDEKISRQGVSLAIKMARARKQPIIL